MARAEDAGWDAAKGVGLTATMVAAARAMATHADDPLIDDPYAESLVRAVGVDLFTRWAAGELAAVGGAELARMTTAVALRTRYFDSFLLDAIDSGIRQAVILGSGLDTRAYRLAWPADMTVFELDQPEVLDFKTATLANLGATPAADFRPVATDLRHDWPSALRAAGLDTDRPTAWIAEGLFGYLSPQVQDRLLDNVTALSAPGSRLASEAIPTMSPDQREKAREMTRAATAQFHDLGVGLDLGELKYDDDRKDVAAYLKGLGWQSIATPASSEPTPSPGNVYYTSIR